MSAVSAAGPVSNLLTASLCAVPIRAGLVPWRSPLDFSGLEGLALSGLLRRAAGLRDLLQHHPCHIQPDTAGAAGRLQGGDRAASAQARPPPWPAARPTAL